MVLGFAQPACGPGGDSDVVRSGGQEGSRAGGPAPVPTQLGAPAPELDPAQRAALASRVVFLGTSLTAGLGLDDPMNRFTDRI